MPVRLRKGVRKLGRKLAYPTLWARATWRGRALRQDFDGVARWLTFVGYPRTGSSLVGALLDAHPQMVVSDQLHALRFVRYGFRRDALFWLALERSRALAAAGRGANGYAYALAGPGVRPGGYTRLCVVGDKRADTSAQRLVERPALLEELRRAVRCPVAFLHPVRNPYDMVATMFRRGRRRDLEHALRQFEGLARAMRTLVPRIPEGDLLVLRHEDLVGAPRRVLRETCGFLGVDAPEGWLASCADLVWRQPSRTRKEVDWRPEHLERIAAAIETTPGLGGYAFDD